MEQEANRVLVSPGVVPIALLTKLAQVGVHTTAEVHRHIEAGTLQGLPGIGSMTEARVLRHYTFSAALGVEAVPFG